MSVKNEYQIVQTQAIPFKNALVYTATTVLCFVLPWVVWTKLSLYTIKYQYVKIECDTIESLDIQ